MSINRTKIAGFLGAAAVLGSLLVGSVAFAAPPSTPPGHNKIQCFDGTTDGGYGGTCTTKNSGVNSPVTLSNNSTNPAGDYSGAYFQDSSIVGQTLGSITKLGYTYSGTTAPMPGDLSLNIPLSAGGYAYIDAYYCPGTNGVVDVINDANCGIWYNGIEYANWAALVAAYPTATVSGTPFIVAERTPSESAAVWTISKVNLGQK